MWSQPYGLGPTFWPPCASDGTCKASSQLVCANTVASLCSARRFSHLPHPHMQDLQLHSIVSLNGLIIGVHRHPDLFVQSFRKRRRAGRLYPSASIYQNLSQKSPPLPSRAPPCSFLGSLRGREPPPGRTIHLDRPWEPDLEASGQGWARARSLELQQAETGLSRLPVGVVHIPLAGNGSGHAVLL